MIKFKDENGYLNMLGSMLIALIIFFLILLICIPIYVITNYYEVKTFNKLYETDYTFSEWFWSEYNIKDFHKNEVKQLNVDLDLTKKGVD